MFRQKLQKLFLEGFLPMMFFLIVDVRYRFRHLGSSNAEGAMHEVADIGVGHGSLLSTIRFTDCDFVFGVIPPINRWATIIRPLRGLVELLFVQGPLLTAHRSPLIFL
jgi:hypothetical protein